MGKEICFMGLYYLRCEYISGAGWSFFHKYVASYRRKFPLQQKTFYWPYPYDLQNSTAHDAEKYAASCAGQLNLYRQAVEAATGKKVLQTIIHLPNLGMCFEVK